MSTTKFPKVGVAVILRREQYILIGERISSLGKDTWGLPGGKLDFGEDLIDGAVREVFEETGIEITPISLSLVGTTSAIFDEETHYITVIYEVLNFMGNPEVKEPDKVKSWEWVSLYDLPDNLFLPLKNFVHSYDFFNYKVYNKTCLK